MSHPHQRVVAVENDAFQSFDESEECGDGDGEESEGWLTDNRDGSSDKQHGDTVDAVCSNEDLSGDVVQHSLVDCNTTSERLDRKPRTTQRR